MRRLIVIALAATLGLLLGSASRAQRLDGTLRVTVTDKTQASIEEAKVTAQNDATGVSTATTASSSGTYVFPNLLVGTYTVTVEKDGFKKPLIRTWSLYPIKWLKQKWNWSWDRFPQWWKWKLART